MLLGRLQVAPEGIPGHPKEEGLLDSLGRLGTDRSDGQISRLVATLFMAPNASAGDAVKFFRWNASRPIPGQSCKEEGFLDFLSVPNQAQMTVTG